MLTCGRVDTRVGQHQPSHRAPVANVLLNDLVGVCFADTSVPDCLGINDHGWPVLALIEASGLIGSHATAQSVFHQLAFEHFLQVRAAIRRAASAGMARGPLIAANEDVMGELGHCFSYSAADCKVNGSTVHLRKGTSCS